MLKKTIENKYTHFQKNLLEMLDKCVLWKHKGQVLSRWLNRKEGRAHPLPRQLIVSLTSYPLRFSTLSLTLKCLLTQTVKPDRLILWIAHKDRDNLPSEVLCLEKHNLEILYCDDLKSYKKIIPLLHITQDAFIVTADDDVCYWNTWLEELVDGYSGNNSEVLCHRAHKIRMRDSVQPLPYIEWDLRIEEETPSPFVFPTGMGGVLYPPKIFHSDIFNSELFTSLCPSGDDIWLYWMSRLNGGEARRVGTNRDLFLWPETLETSLWNTNKFPEGNDTNIRSMVKKYGFPQ